MIRICYSISLEVFEALSHFDHFGAMDAIGKMLNDAACDEKVDG